VSNSQVSNSEIVQRKNRIGADITLLVVALVWGSAFVAQRFAAQEIGVFLFNGLRFLIGAIVLLPFIWVGVLQNNEVGKIKSKDIPWIALAGFLLFGGAAFQQAGMIYTTAGNAGFITGLYVVLIPLFMGLIWKQKLRSVIWLAALLSVLGLFLLSTGGKMQLNPGDLLELIGAGFWAFHVILIGRLVKRMEVLRLAVGQYLVCGLLSLSVGLLFEVNTLPDLVNSLWALLYTGVLSVGLGYTLQVVGQRVAPAPDAAIILSLEAVFAALCGWIFLGENLSWIQMLGCGTMLTGMLLAQFDLFFPRHQINSML
jgi:drug/metabolite transporter (DMT)-like permease